MLTEAKTPNQEEIVRRMFQAGTHFGYSKQRNHPSVKNYIFGYKNRSAVIDLEQTLESLKRAKEFVASLGVAGKQILFVGNKDETRGIVSKVAEALNMPYVASRWLGGTFTNFTQIKTRIDRLADLKSKREKGELSVYTKKERLLFDKEIGRLERYFLSLASMTKLPAAIIVIDPKQEAIAVAEAAKVKLPVVALAGTDCDISKISYPVVGNDASLSSINFFMSEIEAAYREGLARQVTVEPSEALNASVVTPA